MLCFVPITPNELISGLKEYYTGCAKKLLEKQFPSNEEL
jgi:hypothetical protein